jgi:putative SOS response-associated peptidase YedK
MCSRYRPGRRALSTFDHRLAEELDEAVENLPRPEVGPRDLGVVLARGRGDILRAVPMYLGFVRPWGPVFNARSEELGKSIWKEAIERRRCAVPMEVFYEWQKPAGGTTKYRFISQESDQDLWAAGVWEGTKAGDLSFSILTKPAPAWMESIHDRCPFLLPPAAVMPYLDGGLDLTRPPDVPLYFKVDGGNQMSFLMTY